MPRTITPVEINSGASSVYVPLLTRMRVRAWFSASAILVDAMLQFVYGATGAAFEIAT